MKDFEKIKKALKKSGYENPNRILVFTCEMDGHEIYSLRSKHKGKLGMAPYFYLENNSIVKLSLDDAIRAVNISVQNQGDNSDS